MNIHQRLIYSKNHQSLLREDFIYGVQVFLNTYRKKLNRIHMKNFFELLEEYYIQKLFFN